MIWVKWCPLFDLWCMPYCPTSLSVLLFKHSAKQKTNLNLGFATDRIIHRRGVHKRVRLVCSNNEILQNLIVDWLIILLWWRPIHKWRLGKGWEDGSVILDNNGQGMGNPNLDVHDELSRIEFSVLF